MIEGVRDFLFYPCHPVHTTKERVLSISTIVALSLFSGGLFAIAFAAVHLRDRCCKPQRGDERIKRLSNDIIGAPAAITNPPSTQQAPAPTPPPVATGNDGGTATTNASSATPSLVQKAQSLAHLDIDDDDDGDADGDMDVAVLSPADGSPPNDKVHRIKQQQAQQLKLFEKWAAAQQWNKIHSAHYDWWMFPVNRPSRGYGDLYAVSDQDIDTLKKDDAFMDNFRRGVALVVEAWGWDLAHNRPIDNPGKGQRWTGYGVRLAKMSDSLQLFGEKKLHNRLRLFFQDCLSKPTPISDIGWLRKTLRTPQLIAPRLPRLRQNGGAPQAP